MNLVVGATGNLGGEICRRLAARGKPIRALVRETSDPKRVDALAELGADLVVGDLRDASSLADACAGVSTVVSGATAVLPRLAADSIATVDLEGQIALVDAARAAGASAFVYVSYSQNIASPSPLTSAKRAVELHLAGSDLLFTVLRPSYFMQTWLGPAVGFDLPSGAATLFGDGTAAVSWIALADVAEVAAACVDEPRAHRRTIELGGPETLSPLEVVQLATEVGGRSIEVALVSLEDLERRRHAARGETDESFAALMLDLARGDVVAPHGLDWLPGPATTVRDYLAALPWPAAAPV